jgi:predicted phage-related endonuclease
MPAALANAPCRANEQIARQVNLLRRWQQAAKMLDRKIGTLRQLITDYIGEPRLLVHGDRALAELLEYEQNRINGRQLEEQFPEVYAKVRETSTVRRLRLVS